MHDLPHRKHLSQPEWQIHFGALLHLQERQLMQMFGHHLGRRTSSPAFPWR